MTDLPPVVEALLRRGDVYSAAMHLFVAGVQLGDALTLTREWRRERGLPVGELGWS